MLPERIRLAGISKTYRTKEGDVDALGDIGFTCERGGFIAVVGPSGCGKTTILRIIGGLEVPSSGEVEIDGLSPDAARRERYFSYGFQNPVLLPWMTIVENVRLLPRLARQEEHTSAAALLAAVGLDGFENRFPQELSGGMRQRAALARALSLDPRYLLLDEPFGALDDLTREALDDLLAETWAAGEFGCLLITHNLGEAVYLADAVVVLSKRPASVSRVVPVTLERPRRAEMRMSAVFLDIVRQVREALT